MTGVHLSALNLDKSLLLEQLLQKHYRRDSRLLLGELQFAFLAFLMGQSLEGGPRLLGPWMLPVWRLLACWVCQAMPTVEDQ